MVTWDPDKIKCMRQAAQTPCLLCPFRVIHILGSSFINTCLSVPTRLSLQVGGGSLIPQTHGVPGCEPQGRKDRPSLGTRACFSSSFLGWQRTWVMGGTSGIAWPQPPPREEEWTGWKLRQCRWWWQEHWAVGMEVRAQPVPSCPDPSLCCLHRKIRPAFTFLTFPTISWSTSDANAHPLIRFAQNLKLL